MRAAPRAALESTEVATPGPARRPSIRYRLAMLVCGCVLPACLVSAYLIYDHYQVERALLLGEALSTARSMVAVVDRDFDTVTTALRTLSSSDDIDSNLAAFKVQAMNVHGILPITDLSLVERSSGRQLINTVVADGQPLPPVGDPALVQRVFDQGQPVVSDLYRPSADVAPYITVGVPVYRGGVVTRALSARLLPQTLSTILTEQKLPDSWRVSISDNSGKIVARTRMINELLGKNVNKDLLAHLKLAPEGRFESVTQDGIPAVILYSQSPKSGWTVALAIPLRTLSAGLARTLESLILATVVLLTLGLTLAWLLGGRIARSIQALIAPATALGTGAPISMPRLDFKEAEQLAASLLRAAAVLQEARQAASNEMAERRTAQAALMAADLRKDEFLATLAHELRNPMAPLVNALEILRMGSVAGEPRGTPKNVLDIMERQLRQMVHLVDDLLDVSRITTNKLSIKHEQLNLQEIISYAQETVGLFIDKRGHHLLVSLPPEPIALLGDATRLSQVFANLLNNAAKYTQPGGSIGLTAQRRGERVLVTVSDTGIGIAADVLPRIFDIFFQADQSLGRSQAGLGIGLPLARRLVELHGGSIRVDSPGLGLGSTVSVELPIAMPGSAGHHAASQASPGPDSSGFGSDSGLGAGPGFGGDTVPGPGAPAASGATPTSAARATQGAADDGGKAAAGGQLDSYRVLLADDNVDNANTLRTLLSSLGQQIHVSYDGMGALLAAEAFRPQFAFLDIGMPGLDGYELARRLRENAVTADCVLIAVTGWGQDKDQQRSRAAGFDFHIVKPVRLEQLRDILARKHPPAR